MARFSEVVPTAGRYVNAADKAMLAGEDDFAPVALRLVGARYQPRATFGPRWLVECKVVATGDMVAVDFAAADKAGTPIEARMSAFAELRDRLDAGEAFEPVVLARIAPAAGGNPFWTFLDAPPELVAKPVAPTWANDEDLDLGTPSEPAPKLAKARR